MATDAHYDIAIIGSGAGGGTLAHALAPTGKRILILERGDWLPREKENWDARAVFKDERYHTAERWYDRHGKPFRPGANYYVGGNTKVYGAVLLRFRGRDFEEVRHHDGISPAWPLRYQDFAPYYTRAELLYAVHGERGSDPTEPPADAPYPFPAVSQEPRLREVYDGLAKQGLRPFPLPVGIRLEEARPERSLCIRCNTCDGYPCLVDAKADAATTCVVPALRHENVTLLTQAYVSRLETDASGRSVTGLRVRHPSGELRISADIVVVAAGAINSAALLLRSAGDRHPNGLANSSDQVGRNYMCHNNSALLAISRRPNESRFTKTIGLNDFYWGADDSAFPLGHVQTLGKSLPGTLESDAPSIRLPGIGLTLEQMARHAVDWWIITEDLPRPNNRVTLTAAGEIQLSYTPNNLEPHRRLLGKLRHALEHVEGGMTHLIPHGAYLSKQLPIAGVGHQNGTCRFGTDPRSSVLDVNCKAHDLDNLYVVDGAFFPSSTACNPTLTIIANALRVGDHLMERLGTTRPEMIGAGV